jgi:hypothetical protein
MRGNGGTLSFFFRNSLLLLREGDVMPFNLILGRKPFTVVNDLCDKYEEKFKEKVATAKVVNVLIAEALIHRGLIPSTYIKEHYGCDNPIDMGFTPNARKEKPVHEVEKEKRKIEEIEHTLTNVYKLWNTLKPSAQAYHLKTAREHTELPISQLILKEKGEAPNE